MNSNQPPGWGPPPGQPPGGAFGASQQPGFGAPAQPGFGAPAQPGYGQPAQPGFGAPAHGQPAYGPPGHPPAPGSGTFGPAAPAPAPGRKLGMFESVPCPHCGTAMRSSSGNGAIAAGVVGGAVGMMILSAIASKYYCPTHGEVPTSALPAEHRSVVKLRRFLMAGGAGALFLFAVCLMCLASALRSF